MPFRKLDYDQKYKKYQWIEVELEKNTSDIRPESYKIVNPRSLTTYGEPLGRKNAWRVRRDWVFARNRIHTNMDNLINLAWQNKLSLAIFKPTKFLDFVYEPVEKEWSKKKLKNLEHMAKQLHLFQTPEETKKQFQYVNKLPYKFSYRFTSEDGKNRKLMIEDWEIGMLFWKCLRDSSGDEETALQKVRMKYWDYFIKRDLHLFLGTTKEHHVKKAKNPFVIIGVFPPPYETIPPLYRSTQYPLPSI